MTSDRMSSKLAASLQASSEFLQHMEKPVSSPEHLCNGSLWFDILLDVGFKPKVSGSDFSIDLDVLAKQELNPSTAQAIVHMNALVLTAYTHSSAGLKQFCKLDQVYEDTLSEDMAEVGGDLRNETAKIKVDLEEVNTELNAIKESHQGHDMQHEQQKVNGKIRFMLEQDKEKLQCRNKELDDAYRVTGLMLTKAEDLAQQWADLLGKNAQDQLVLYRQAVKPHQDQVIQDEEDIMVINSSDEALQQLQTADEDLHAKLVNLEQEQHQTLKANKILEVEVAKKNRKQILSSRMGSRHKKNNEIEELQSQLVTGPKVPSFAEESAIAKMQKDLDILEEQLAMTINNKNDKTMQELTITLAISRDSQYWACSSPEETGRLLPLSSREQERHKTYQELQGQNAQVQAQDQQIQSNLNDQTSQLHELQQKHNELQNKWDVQKSVLSSSSEVGSRRDTKPKGPLVVKLAI
ncbi:hypothetical protein DFH08DRAFT_803499 [Mycena albidolilacea]|uniref:Uncharacterized protein n=1 Tax=Mycena albidolilacea TaxID=1033008 RepID=A0AAD7ACX5_9AGAR|nr:hypothetical protein DFH08DRAFT_803499 [Mycena albidolilacea]